MDGNRELVLSGLTKDFAGLRALDGVDLRLARGEIVGLIGPNGSGKTTLINVVTGLFPASSGSVVADGTEITNKPAFRIARAGVARTFQTIRLFRELTVRENVEVAAVSMGLDRRTAASRAMSVIEDMALAEWRDMSAGALPYGLERRVEVARALAMEPCFLLLDEPAAGLNEEESDQLLETLAAIPAAKDLGMLIVDHDMRLIMRLCHRLHVLSYGKTIAEGTPEQVRSTPAVVEAYLGSAASGRA
jgi:branched-chain amino acid transport system ATP-binding protein